MHPATFTWSPLNFVPFLSSVPRLDGRCRQIRAQIALLRESVAELFSDERRCSGRRGLNSFAHHFRRCRAKAMGRSDRSLLSRLDKTHMLRYFTSSQLRRSGEDVLGMGAGPVAETLAWALVFMAAYPHAQQKAAEELEDQLDARPPDYQLRSLPLHPHQ